MQCFTAPNRVRRDSFRGVKYYGLRDRNELCLTRAEEVKYNVLRTQNALSITRFEAVKRTVLRARNELGVTRFLRAGVGGVGWG